MSAAQERMAKLLAEAERTAYERGWKDAIAAINKAAVAAQPAAPCALIEPSDDRPRGRPAWAMNLVREAVQSTPGMRGVELVKAINDRGSEIAERTARTCLRRLRRNKEIWQRNGRWYPKSKERAEIENGSGEAPAALPH